MSNRWTVWRKDDSGQCFIINSHLTETQAYDLVKKYTAKYHKQTYLAVSKLGYQCLIMRNDSQKRE